MHKPEFQKCPEPPVQLFDWLTPGWDRYVNTTAHKETLAEPQSLVDIEGDLSSIKHFADSDERVRLYEKWITARNTWVERQRVINGTRRFFARLFQAYTDLERESETLEFIVGDGIIQSLESQSINHPILMKRVKYEFDAKENVIRIVDTDTEPVLGLMDDPTE